MKTPNNEKEGKDTQTANVSFFSLFSFNDILLKRQSNSLEILYYWKVRKAVIFCNYIFLAMCSYQAVTFFPSFKASVCSCDYL